MSDSSWYMESYAAYQTIFDLWALDWHLEILKRELPRIVEAEREKIWADVKVGDEEAKVGADAAEYYLDEGLSTRFITGTAIIVVWATYESGVRRCAERIRATRKLRLHLRDIKGTNFLDQANKYFEGVLECKLHTDEAAISRLQALARLRHALAHANGQLDDMPDKDRAELEKMVASVPGLKVAEGCVIVSLDFIERAIAVVKQALTDLGERTEVEVQRVI